MNFIKKRAFKSSLNKYVIDLTNALNRVRTDCRRRNVDFGKTAHSYVKNFRMSDPLFKYIYLRIGDKSFKVEINVERVKHHINGK